MTSGDVIRRNTRPFKHTKDSSAFLKTSVSSWPHTNVLPPSTSVEWLGYYVDSISMSVTILTQKLKDVLSECGQWLLRNKASKKMIQAIVGKLIFISNCVHQGRKFLARILLTLSNMKDGAWTTLSTQFKADIKWFFHYAESANGIFLCPPILPLIEIECDSSLKAAGGVADGVYYTWIYTQKHRNNYPQIYQLEVANILVAYKTLAPVFNKSAAHVIVWTDNITSSFALQTGKTKDPLLASCSRELWLQAAIYNHQIEIKHKSGALLQLADALSRMHNDKEKAALAHSIIARSNLKPVSPIYRDTNFSQI